MPEDAIAPEVSNEAYEVAKARVKKSLKGFTDDYPRWSHAEEDSNILTFKPDRNLFPVPDLVLFMMRNMMQWKSGGVGEKTRWTVYGSVDGTPVLFEMRKFGFTIGIERTSKVTGKRVIGQLQSALKHVEKFLEPIAKYQVSKGEMLIVNHYAEFEDRYQFFRSLADEAYSESEKPPKKKKKKKKKKVKGKKPFALMTDMVAFMNHSSKMTRKGFYYSAAMVDAYFSALEHRLLLLRAFTGVPLREGEMLNVLKAKWDEKLKIVVPNTNTPEMANILGKMREIKERIRNPFAHGGVENDGGSMFFHMPHIGAIPANLSQFGKSVRFTVVPIEIQGHQDVCKIFDELDAVLQAGALERPHTLLTHSVDPSFDQKSMAKYADAISGTEENLERFIERWSYEWERHTNMDH
jgi:hypothetical protein